MLRVYSNKLTFIDSFLTSAGMPCKQINNPFGDVDDFIIIDAPHLVNDAQYQMLKIQKKMDGKAVFRFSLPDSYVRAKSLEHYFGPMLCAASTDALCRILTRTVTKDVHYLPEVFYEDYPVDIEIAKAKMKSNDFIIFCDPLLDEQRVNMILCAVSMMRGRRVVVHGGWNNTYGYQVLPIGGMHSYQPINPAISRFEWLKGLSTAHMTVTTRETWAMEAINMHCIPVLPGTEYCEWLPPAFLSNSVFGFLHNIESIILNWAEMQTNAAFRFHQRNMMARKKWEAFIRKQV